MGKQEEALIERLRTRFPDFALGLGIGDDAALLNFDGTLVLTNDMLVEDVDFTSIIPIEFVARKSLAVNLSDLAAMGASPIAFLLAIGVPADAMPKLTRFFDALAVYAQQRQVPLIGGDLSSAEKIVISVTALGTLRQKDALLRSGAQAGDRIYVSRPLGGSAAGLQLLRAGWSIDANGSVFPPPGMEHTYGYAQREFGAAAILQHVLPEPEIELGLRLAALGSVSSCIDISDGLSSDLYHLCRASRRGALIDWERIPPFPDLPTAGRMMGIDAERAMLHGGEDYALLFTSALREADLSERLGRPVYGIGRMVEGDSVRMERGGTTLPLPDEGYDHFA
jgi:thiamine-monophosphate kinase